jgi:hypothetical protein
MTDDELRLVIRGVIQRHLQTAAAAQPPAAAPAPRRDAAPAVASMSFAQYRIERAAGDTMCVVEENVQCNHCGFCKCHGH